MVKYFSILIFAFGCSDFDSPSLVKDLRLLGASLEPPEIVADIDIENPSALDLLSIPPTEICWLVADPGTDRDLGYIMNVCPPSDEDRCEDDAPQFELARGILQDPETAGDVACATLPPSQKLLEILLESVRADDLAGFGNVSVQINSAFFPLTGTDLPDVPPAEAEWGSRSMRYAPRLPASRVANQNPLLTEFTVEGDGRPAASLPLEPCSSATSFLSFAPGEQVKIVPQEPDGARETYVVPTLDGGSRQFTENLTYNWFATAGDFSSDSSGGTKDIAGNPPVLSSKWTAPDQASDAKIEFWIVIRDERGGQSWVQSCGRFL